MPNADTSHQITRLLGDWRGGDESALERLTPLVYTQLRRMAASQLRRERAGHTLQPTALVNELYLELAEMDDRISWENRAHFLAMAATMMRRILVQHARVRLAAKRGGGVEKVALDESIDPAVERPPEVLALDEALDALARQDARKARILELRYFAGLSVEEIGAVLNISAATIGRESRLAHAWLHRYLDTPAVRTTGE
jgi:RNA polymerase sigma factor (TIGR02999 family)